MWAYPPNLKNDLDKNISTNHMFANQYFGLLNMRLGLLSFIDYQLNIIVKSCCLVLLL